MIRNVRHGKEKEVEIVEPVEWPPRRRSNPEPSREPQREAPSKPRRKREKTPA